MQYTYFGMETIDYQRPSSELARLDDVFQSLITLYVDNKANYSGLARFNPFYDVPKDQVDNLLKQASELINRRFNMNVTIESVNGDYGVAYTYPIPLNQKHILTDDRLKDGKLWTLFDTSGNIERMHAEYLKSLNKPAGINLKTGKLSGAFSELGIRIGICLPTLIFELKASPRELSAAILHEVGHSLTYAEYADRIHSGNQVILDTLEGLKKAESDKDYQYWISKSVASDLINKNDFDDLMKTHRVILPISYIAKVMKNYGKTLKINTYDKTSSEQVADSYAYRLGYGKELVTILDRIYKNDFHKNISDTLLCVVAMWISYHLVLFPMIILVTLFPILYLIVPYLFAVLHTIVTLMVAGLLGLGSNNINRTYDVTKVRFQRIRDQYVETIKTMEKTKNDHGINMNDHLEGIRVIDEIISRYSNNRSLVNYLLDLILNSNKTAYRAVYEEQLIESLSSNNLHVRHQELKLLLEKP